MVLHRRHSIDISRRFCYIQHCFEVDNIVETLQIYRTRQTNFMHTKFWDKWTSEADDCVTNCKTEALWYKAKCEVQTTFKMIYQKSLFSKTRDMFSQHKSFSNIYRKLMGIPMFNLWSIFKTNKMYELFILLFHPKKLFNSKDVCFTNMLHIFCCSINENTIFIIFFLLFDV